MLAATAPTCFGIHPESSLLSWSSLTVLMTYQAEQSGAISLPSGTAATNVSYQECERSTEVDNYGSLSTYYSEVTYFDSIVAYLGSQPYNADSVKGDDTLTYNYSTLDVSISIPPSFNFNPDYRDVQNDSLAISNNWQLWKHNVRIESDGPADGWSYNGHNHTLVGSFTFGGDNYNTVLNHDWPT